MKNKSDDAFMSKMKAMDFSQESANYDKNLEVLQGKLAIINEERCQMNGLRRIRKPFAILVAVIALMVVSAATLVASHTMLNRSTRAARIQHDDGNFTIVAVASETGTVRISECGLVEFVHECGTLEVIELYDAADLCPTDELLNTGAYSFYRTDDAPGLVGIKSYTSDMDEVFLEYYANAGYGAIQVGIHTIFYRMTDDYGVVEGAAEIQADGAVYFVANCGERTLLYRP